MIVSAMAFYPVNWQLPAFPTCGRGAPAMGQPK